MLKFQRERLSEVTVSFGGYKSKLPTTSGLNGGHFQFQLCLIFSVNVCRNFSEETVSVCGFTSKLKTTSGLNGGHFEFLIC